jgi:hypothetical protein
MIQLLFRIVLQTAWNIQQHNDLTDERSKNHPRKNKLYHLIIMKFIAIYP